MAGWLEGASPTIPMGKVDKGCWHDNYVVCRLQASRAHVCPRMHAPTGARFQGRTHYCVIFCAAIVHRYTGSPVHWYTMESGKRVVVYVRAQDVRALQDEGKDPAKWVRALVAHALEQRRRNGRV